MTWRAVSAGPGAGAQGDFDVNLTLCGSTRSKQAMLDVDAGLNAVIAAAGRASHSFTSRLNLSRYLH